MIVYQRLFLFFPDTQIYQNSLAKFFIPSFLEIFLNFKVLHDQLGRRFPGICFEKLINFELSYQI